MARLHARRVGVGAVMAERTLKLNLTESARRGQMMYHSMPGIMLIVYGVSALLEGHSEHLWVDILGIVAGAALLISLRRELKSKGHGHSRVAWFDVLAGIVVIIEGYHKLHPGRWFQPGTLLMLVGVMFILIGIFHNRLNALRRLTCTDEGFKVRTRPIRSFSGLWKDIKSFALDGNSLVIQHKDNSTEKHSLRRIENRAEMLGVLNEELERKSLPKQVV